MPDQTTELARLLIEEYRLVQTKIDNIGGFKFRVRGWSITAASGLLIASSSDPLPNAACLLAPLVIIAFAYLEQEQDELALALGNRARLIENVLDRLTVERDEPERLKEAYKRTIPNHIGQLPSIALIMRRAARIKWTSLLTRGIEFRKANAFVWFQLSVSLLVCALLLGQEPWRRLQMEAQAWHAPIEAPSKSTHSESATKSGEASAQPPSDLAPPLTPPSTPEELDDDGTPQEESLESPSESPAA